MRISPADRQPGEMVGGHVGQGGERAFQDQPRAPSSAARSTATAPPIDSPISTTSRSAILPAGPASPRGPGVGQNARLVGPALAPAVAAVVEDQDRGAGRVVQASRRMLRDG